MIEDVARPDVCAFEGRVVLSDFVVGFPNEKTECCDEDDHDEHPVLALDAEKAEFFDQKLHGTRPFVEQRTRFGGRNILFLYRGAHSIVAVAKRFCRR